LKIILWVFHLIIICFSFAKWNTPEFNIISIGDFQIMAISSDHIPKVMEQIQIETRRNRFCALPNFDSLKKLQ